jgi:hypothetical protein
MLETLTEQVKKLKDDVNTLSQLAIATEEMMRHEISADINKYHQTRLEGYRSRIDYINQSLELLTKTKLLLKESLLEIDNDVTITKIVNIIEAIDVT